MGIRDLATATVVVLFAAIGVLLVWAIVAASVELGLNEPSSKFMASPYEIASELWKMQPMSYKI
jgi:hypothetical protein